MEENCSCRRRLNSVKLVWICLVRTEKTTQQNRRREGGRGKTWQVNLMIDWDRSQTGTSDTELKTHTTHQSGLRGLDCSVSTLSSNILRIGGCRSAEITRGECVLGMSGYIIRCHQSRHQAFSQSCRVVSEMTFLQGWVGVGWRRRHLAEVRSATVPRRSTVIDHIATEFVRLLICATAAGTFSPGIVHFTDLSFESCRVRRLVLSFTQLQAINHPADHIFGHCTPPPCPGTPCQYYCSSALLFPSPFPGPDSQNSSAYAAT